MKFSLFLESKIDNIKNRLKPIEDVISKKFNDLTFEYGINGLSVFKDKALISLIKKNTSIKDALSSVTNGLKRNKDISKHNKGPKKYADIGSYNEDLSEAIRTLSDNKIEEFITKNWSGKATTYEYNAEAVMELGKVLKDIVLHKSKNYFHVRKSLDDKTLDKINTIINKYKIKEVK